MALHKVEKALNELCKAHIHLRNIFRHQNLLVRSLTKSLLARSLLNNERHEEPLSEGLHKEPLRGEPHE